MIRIIIGIFFALHGLVHLLYMGQSARIFELQPGMLWPDNSWAFSRLLGNEGVRTLASVLLVVAALGFLLGGVGLLVQQPWWRPVIIGSAIFSAVMYVLLWDGVAQALDNKGGVGLLINLAILAVIVIFRWPRLDA